MFYGLLSFTLYAENFGSFQSVEIMPVAGFANFYNQTRL